MAKSVIFAAAMAVLALSASPALARDWNPMPDYPDCLCLRTNPNHICTSQYDANGSKYILARERKKNACPSATPRQNTPVRLTSR